MIPPDKLNQLSKGHRRRKLALCFGSLERDIAGIAEKGNEYAFPSMTRQEYTKRLVEIVLDDPQLPENAKFCPGCGKPVAQKAFCINCGNQVPSNAKFCPNCGKQI
jgi:RNA polymerase subunit RPABC4/transcription elongation factor Spt4